MVGDISADWAWFASVSASKHGVELCLYLAAHRRTVEGRYLCALDKFTAKSKNTGVSVST
jgi:hypothetical protein